MKITKENYKVVPENEQSILLSLLDDLDDINGSSLYSNNLYIIWIKEHTDWSPERTDPCPDYYGYYRLMLGKDYIGEIMSLDQLDSAMCLLYNIMEHENLYR